MSNSGEQRPGSISVAELVSGTDRGAAETSNNEVVSTTAEPQASPEQQYLANEAAWLRIERVEFEKREQDARWRVLYLLFGILAVVFVFGLGTLALCAFLDLPDAAIIYFLIAVLGILSAAIGVAIRSLFKRGWFMTG
jgi:hypothetical protein